MFCGYSLEATQRGAFNEFPEHVVVFSGEIRKTSILFLA